MSPDKPISSHVPVLLEETVEALAVQPGGRYIDCTLGGGGHARAILERSSLGGQLLGIDANPDAIKIAKTNLGSYRDSYRLVNENFVNLQAVCIKYDFSPVHGILFDLGLSSFQLNGNGRGFSFQYDAPLDMRFSPDQEVTAANIVNTLSEVDLARYIRMYGEENYSHLVARHIVKERPINSTLHLAQVIERAIGQRRGKIHPATRTFQALRIMVNRELENLGVALRQAVNLLGFEGRLVVISYHSLEDRIVKQFLQQEARDCICPPGVPVCICGHKAQLRLVYKKVIVPSPAEIRHNQRSRSARLRVVERIIAQEDYDNRAEMERVLIGANAGTWRRPFLVKKLKVIFAAA
jgi:16S rRNA (cytosine1402-N4)-methyltransferase